MTTKRISRDDIDKFFEFDIDLSTKTMYLGSIMTDWEGYESGVDHNMAERVIKSLHILDRTKKDQPIIIKANNPGGSWYHGMAIFDAIAACESPVHMEMFGYAMSMGSIIPQAADKRIIAPNARFMIHYGYDGGYGHSKNFEKWADEGKRVNLRMENIYLDKMMEKDEEEDEDRYLERVLAEIVNKQQQLELPTPEKVVYHFSSDPDRRREDVRKVLKVLLNFDTFLNAEETVALGLADEVMEL